MITVVVPIYNEEETIRELQSRLVGVLEGISEESEVIFVDDGSRDTSLGMIKRIHHRDRRFKAISFSRNFGHQTAVSAGLKFAGGDAVIVMDGDLQDPPELIPEFIKKWKEGNDVVYAIRTKRKEPILRRIEYRTFYMILNLIADIDIPLDSGDFCLMDRKVVNIMNSLPERGRFIRGLRGWVGFRQTGIEFERDQRFGGRSKYGFWKLLRLALDGLFSFSQVPLKIATAMGLVVSGVSLLFSAYVVFNYVMGTRMIFINIDPGWASIIVSITFLGGVQLISIGILGEYLSRVFGEVKRRPHFIIDELVGMKDEKPPGERDNPRS